MRTTVNIVSISEGKILLCCKKGIWILPGGKIVEGESDTACIIRECQEEIPGSTVSISSFFGNFEGITPHSKTLIGTRVYLGTISEDITPAAEIERTGEFTKEEVASLPVSELTTKILSQIDF